MPRCKLTSKRSEILLLRSTETEKIKMKTTIKQKLLRKIADALEKTNLPDHSEFYAEDDMSMENIKIEIDQVGELSFPLSDNCIEKLVNISSKAHFGSGEQTLLDENIRNTHEITSDKLHIAFNEEALDRMMDKLRKVLGLNDNCVLSPHLHNMLIYRTGQFFDMHQDSEKLENMIGTLVIILPNAHIGGDLVIELGEKKHVFSSEGIKPVNAKCIAFYADCNHKVEKVKDGYRIALTYNLVLKAEEPALPSLVNRRLCEAVKKYFDLKEDKQKLVYFLNHSYTEHGLKWNILKGEDRTNSLALRSVAKELGLIPHLALVEIKETWAAEAFNDPDDLLEEETTLSFWVNSDNKKVPFSRYDISDTDICLTVDTNSFEPYYKEYEGYTGNAGNTMDYWYRRAAIVLWPESVKFSMNFMIGYDYSLLELYELCKTSGNQKKVMKIIAQAGKYLCKSYSESLFYDSKSNENEKNNILKLASIALYIESSDTAFSLLSNSRWRILSCDFAEQLANLQLKYGVEWCIKLLNKMKTNSSNLNLDDIDLLIASFLEHKVDTSIVKLLLDVQYEVITKEIAVNRQTSLLDLKNTLPKRMVKLHKFFKACLICKDFTVLSKIIPNVVSNTEQYPLTSLTKLYVKFHENTQPEEKVHFKELRSYLTKTIDHKIISGEQSEDDWSINVQLPCNCEFCAIATSFLRSKTEKMKVWPLKEKLRNHVMRCFRSSDLPVKLTVERTGSPHKLVLVKTEALHKNASKEFKKLKLCQQKLRALNE
ncbi:hypothetical protein AVEN_145028-1 [Araneus ventricosus]|uniref:Prolyl 4-hydroxylase alpha subunit Fe(2+) 2OG dioxygenase domain-containing protein n=1 Tax=Araneus ventricosus TaxID=182803 RepID=A0A4Y2LB64_ARAVE|nr:hypothetical protein AVEN_145028-1 [Araneus ventricosus]